MKKHGVIITVLLVIILIATGCGRKSYENNSLSYDGSRNESSLNNNTGKLADYDNSSFNYTNRAEISKSDVSEEKGLTNTTSVTSGESQINTHEKIIRRINMDVETKEFDDLIKNIDKEINRLQGYVESSEISGNRYYNRNSLRYANIIARIPKDKLDQFVEVVKDIANVVRTSQSTENVTLQYIDVESHKKSLEIEQERLFAILEKEDTLDHIITLESRLSSIRYELQQYESRLRTYDNQVEYSTITLSIDEVERISSVSTEDPSAWKKIADGFSDSIYNVGNAFKNLFIWFVINIPYFVILGACVLITLFVIKRFQKKAIKNKSNFNQNPPVQNPPTDHLQK